VAPGTSLLAAIAIALVVVLASLVARAWRRASRRRLARRRMARASAGEQQAAALLETFGFELLGAQVATSYELLVDGAPHDVRVRADYVVARSGLAYVAEVKTGAVAPRIETIATRRQLLEYRVAFDVAGVLLVDVEAALVREVRFPRTGARTNERADVWLPLVVAIGSLAAGTFVSLAWG
jgi:hypothetical protein